MGRRFEFEFILKSTIEFCIQMETVVHHVVLKNEIIVGIL